MSRDTAKQQYTRQPGEPQQGFVTASDAQAAIDIMYDDFDVVGSERTGVFNVKDYGATGDGVTDDTAAIEAAILAAGPGGRVYFPAGTYNVSRTLWPEAGQTWTGDHSPAYQIYDTADTYCTVQAASGFTGRALVERQAGASGVALERLCFSGLGDTHPDALSGVHFGDMSAERSWNIRGCTIRMFSGSGITGRLHVADIAQCHVARNGYGLRVTGLNGLTDVRITGCQFYYNLHGGMCLDSDRRNGMVSVHSTRFERSGSTPGDPSINRDAAAPGVRIRNAQNCDLVQVTTDANSGPGLDVDADPVDDKRVYSLSVIGCQFARDGGGDQSPGVQMSGVRFKSASHVMFTGNNVTWGLADDGGSGTLISPFYALWIEDVFFGDFSHSWVTSEDSDNSIHLAGDNYRTRVQATHLGLDALQASSDAARPAFPGLPVGAAYWSTSEARPKYWDGSDWRSADGSIEGEVSGNPLDVDGGAEDFKSVRFTVDGVPRWSAVMLRNSQDASWTLQRLDAAGEYIEDSIRVLGGTGAVETKQLRAASNSPSAVPLHVSHAVSPTNSFIHVADGEGNVVFQVLWDGTLRSNWGDSRYAMTQIGSTQVVREGATGSQTLIGAYTSVAEANDDSPVFEVQADGSVWSDYVLGSGDGGKYLTPKAYVDGIKTSLKAEVAASTDFADFQSRIASW